MGRAPRDQAIWLFPALIVGIGVIKGIAYLGQFYGMGLFGQRVGMELRRALFIQLCALSPRQLSANLSGDLLSRFSADVASVEVAATYALGSYVRDGLQIVILLVVALMLDWKITLGALLILPIAAIPVSRLTRGFLRKSHQAQERIGMLAGQVNEGLGALRTLQAFNAESAELSRFQSSLAQYRQAITQAGWLRTLVPALMEILGAVAIGGALGFAASNQSVPAENLVSIVTAIVLIYQPAKDLGKMNSFALQAAISGGRIFEVLDEGQAPPLEAGPTASRPLRLQKGIRFQEISFSYADRPALREVTMQVPLGKTTALVGPSGGGKSTLVSLLLRFERPSSGKIFFDQADVNHLSLDEVHRQFALVTQEPLLFAGTVLDNIAYGRPMASLAEVIEAAEIADAARFIQAMPDGYQTRIGERGVRLSGGQRQRLCLARAVLKNAPILVLDEATSSLDPEGEREVQEAMARVLPGRTALIIAHRLWTIRSADCIHVLDQGRIIESGNHHQLLELEGMYWRLWHLQQRTPERSERAPSAGQML
jgi:subfamily B ATP-binding cassette protein MsbA